MPHAQVHAELRRAVPGPASAAAGADVLERRRDHLMELLGGRVPAAYGLATSPVRAGDEAR